MDVTDITPQLKRLDGDLDELEAALEPLVDDLAETSSRLPLLDKAKLYVLVTYAIESLLFSSLRLNGVETRNHAIFKELTRVKQYFDKIRKIEEPAAAPTASVDRQAAIRFIRSDLADNEEIKKKLSEQLAKERAKAAVKASRGEKRRLSDDDGGGASLAGSGNGDQAREAREDPVKRPKLGGSKAKK